jgi:catechol 2,3-dioxygenase-like lactoylglutathione lyase family enzyme
MLRNAAVTAFLATARSRAAKKFYGKILGLPLVSEDEFGLVFRTAGAPLRIQKVAKLTPQPFTALGWQVTNIHRTVRQLSKRGVMFERYPFFEQDEDAVWSAPSGAKVAWFKDPDGQILSLTQMN